MSVKILMPLDAHMIGGKFARTGKIEKPRCCATYLVLSTDERVDTKITTCPNKAKSGKWL